MYIKKKYQDRIQEMFQDDDGWWIYLNRGWCDGDIGSHTIHADKKKDLMEYLAGTAPCDCDYCKGLKD